MMGVQQRVLSDLCLIAESAMPTVTKLHPLLEGSQGERL